MKLGARTFRIQWDVHAWVGMLASLLLVAVFFFGALALFREEIEVWQEPRLHAASGNHARPTPSYDRALAAVAARSAVPEGARVGFVSLEGVPALEVRVSRRGERRDRTFLVETATGSLLEERSRLAEELYLLHFFYRIPGGMEVTGVFAVALLATLLSGVLLHLKDLWRQKWQFRPGARLRVSASDAHKVLGIFGLPFSAIVAWSGALLALGGLLYGAMTAAAFDGDAARVAALRGRPAVSRQAAERPARGLPLDTLVARAQAGLATEASPHYVYVDHHGDENAVVRVEFDAPPFTDRSYVYLDAVSGKELGRARSTSTSRFERVMFDLHVARFGGLALKIMCALLALFSCVVVLTGNIVWLERRDPSRRALGNRLLERLTIGVTGGAVLGTASAFVANRALPATLSRRADSEIGALVLVWAIVTLVALAVRVPVRRALRAMGVTAALLLLLVVAHDLSTMEPLSRPLAVVDGVLTAIAALAVGVALVANPKPRRARDRSSAELEVTTVTTGEKPCEL